MSPQAPFDGLLDPLLSGAISTGRDLRAFFHAHFVGAEAGGHGLARTFLPDSPQQ
jgi:hypothetical protein